MTYSTHRELFAIECSQEGVTPSCFFLAHFANMADMVYFRQTRGAADAAWYPQFGAGSQANALLEQVDWRTGLREPVALLFPVALGVACDQTFLFALLCLKGGDSAETSDDLAEGALEFGCQGMDEREFETILDAGEAREVIGEAGVILQSSMDTAVPTDEFTDLTVSPCFFRGWVSRGSAEPLGMESVDAVSEGSGHHGL